MLRCAMALALIAVSPQATTPVLPWSVFPAFEKHLASAADRGEARGLLDQAEALLSAYPEDVAILRFAVDSYRLETLRGSDDPVFLERLAELEGLLAQAQPAAALERVEHSER